MMNELQYLSVCFNEELMETGQEVSKCLRFTPDHKPPIYETTNVERATMEFADVFAVKELLEERGFVMDTTTPEFRARIDDKKRRTLESMTWARDLGTLEPEK